MSIRDRGSLVVAGLVGVGLLAAVGAGAMRGGSPDPANLPDAPAEVIADSLIGDWIAALGGMEKYDQFQSATYTVTTVMYDSLSGRVRRMRPRYVWIKKGPHGLATRVERWEGNDFIAQGFNGRVEWATMNGEILPDTAKDWREARYVAGDLHYWPGLPFKLRDEGVFLTYRGLTDRPHAERNFENPDAELSPPPSGYHTVGVSFGEGVGEHQDSWHYYFRPGDRFPTEVTYQEEGRPNVNRVIWGENEFVGELDYPNVMRRDFITDSGKRTKALIVTDLVVNPDIPLSKFERP